ncbi:MAG: hypothetical protein FJY77_03555 [Candidatus Altiarchaeales archaeon]|nr:hypothetical protein [Candidatus Altiarchaeales archaeon]
MAKGKNFQLEVYKNLPKLDCGECNCKTCGEFATAVLKGKKQATRCPHITNEQIQHITLLLDEYANV